MLFVARVTRAAEGNGGGSCKAAMVTNPVHGLPFLPGSSFTDSTVRASPKGSPFGAPLLSFIRKAPRSSHIPASADFARPLGSPLTLLGPHRGPCSYFPAPSSCLLARLPQAISRPLPSCTLLPSVPSNLILDLSRCF